MPSTLTRKCNQVLKINFIASTTDPAGVNIAQKVSEEFQLEETGEEFCGKAVLEKGDFRLLQINVESIFLDQIALPYESDLIIMLTKHQSEKKVNSLTVHPTGNLQNEAILGGKPKHVSYTNPWYMSEYYRNLTELYQTPEKDSIMLSMEVTHHGPTENNRPLFFVEIGSDEERWNNKFLGEMVARALFKTLTEEPKKVDAFVGFGGGHYATAFSNYLKKERIAIGHIVPKYALLENLDEQLLLSLFERSLLNKPKALVDKKGLSSKQYRSLQDFFDRYSIEALKI
ncbi:MAG: D-aminoacyl-tRNA deacylase [Nitrososphaeria archaeon]|jgi:D-aminoacyl-tRNA deacylase